MKICRKARQRLMLSVALVAGPFPGTAWADCTVGSPNQFTCSGTTTAPQRLGPPLTNATVTTTDGFDLIISGAPFQGQALRIWSDGLLTYTDINGSVIDTTATTNFSNGVSFVIGLDIPAGNLASADVFSNGDIFSAGTGVGFSGQGGAPESGRIEAEFTGNIVAGSFGLTGFTGGLGASYTVNNIRAEFSAMQLSSGGSTAGEALVTDDLIINTNGLVSGGNSLAAGSGIFIFLSKSSTGSGGIADNVGAIVNVASTSIVEGFESAITLFNFSSPLLDLSLNPVVVNNDGIIRNLSQLSDDLVISATNVRTVINNENRITGSISLGIYDDLFNNDGIWNTANGVNEFGGGIDRLENAGIVVAAQNATLSEFTSFNSIESFNNNVTGTLQLNDGGTGDVVTINGNYSSANGILSLDTFLGDDASPTDVLVITGNTGGTTRVFVNNVGGTGALTTGDGIRLVDTDPTNALDGVFVLASPAIVGAFQYSLFEGGLSDPFDGDWYLRSLLQPGSGIYEALPSVLLGLMRVGTLAQRIEGRQMLIGSIDPDAPHGAWLRIEGERIELTPDTSNSGLSYDQTTWRLQGGLDMLVSEGDRGQWVAGVNLFTGGSSANVALPAGGGAIATDATGVGLTATWYGYDGFYTDIQLQYANFESDLSSDVLGSLITGLDGSSRLASIEIGQAFEKSHELTWTPQAQLTWSDVTFDSFTGPSGETVSIGSNDSLQLRLGLAVERVWEYENGENARLYGIANLHHELRNRTSVFVSGTELSMAAPAWVGEIGVGGSYDWENDGGGASSLYGEISASRNLSGGTMRGLAGTVGFRIEF